MKALLAAALLLALAEPAVAKPRSLLDTLRAPMPPHATFVQGRAPGVPADAISAMQTDPAAGTVYYTGLLDPSLRAHEVGHLFDSQILSDGDRNYFQRKFFADTGAGAWSRGTGATQGGLLSPNERFADWYMNAAIGNDPSHSWASAYATAPDPKAFRQFTKALDRLGRRRGLKPYK